MGVGAERIAQRHFGAGRVGTAAALAATRSSVQPRHGRQADLGTAPILQRMEVDSARVWTASECANPPPPFQADAGNQFGAECRAANRVSLNLPVRYALGSDPHGTWAPPAAALAAFHRRQRVLNPDVAAFGGVDRYTLRAPAGCVLNQTHWENGSTGVPSSFQAIHPTAQTLEVRWTADYRRRLQFSGMAEGSYESRITVLQCPAGTVVP